MNTFNKTNLKNIHKIKISRVLIILVLPLSTLAQVSDNVEIKKMVDADQNERTNIDSIDWNILAPRDSIRRYNVLKLMNLNQIVTGKDYYRSALIFQHGKDSNDYRIALDFMRKAIELDSSINKWLLAAIIDRELMSRKQPQIYGTQYFKGNSDTAKWELYKIDTTIISDKEREFYDIEPLAMIRERIREKNLLLITEYFKKTNSIKATIELIKHEKKKGIKSEYNVSEFELNSFGYELVNLNKLDHALKIFKLNTKFYPKAANTYDSLGECLLLLSKKRKGINAYKKALQLNPNNKNAEKIINEQK
ncbi:MAG: tetratricopeptide repeat protein [Flavobacteriales bacterium]|nr:tetratricopeptide repeat protein [Flavobacteriales bacterium]